MARIDPTVRLTLGQMRRSLGRLAAAGTAILIGTAFVTATLLAGGVVTRTTYDQVAAQYADGDLVVFDSRGTLTTGDVRTIRAVGGVAAADGLRGTYAELNHDGRTVYQALVGAPSDRRLSPLELTAGAWPDAADRIALPADVADLFGVGVGDTVSATRWLPGAKPSMDERGPDRDGGRAGAERLTVSGLVADPSHAYAASGGVAVVPRAALEQRVVREAGGEAPGLRTVVVALDRADEASLEAARDALAAAAPAATGVTTPAEYAEDVVAGLADGQNIIFLVFVLALAGVSLVVAGLVIANTFQVLVAQRARTLALLRCVGAGTGQVYRTVLLEAAAVGLVSSVLGLAAGALAVQGALLIAPAFDLGVTLPTTVTPSAPVLLLPLGVGVLVTLLAAVAPARAAARVAPLAALGPAVPPGLRGSGRCRSVVAWVAGAGGLVLLAVGVALGTSGRIDVGLFAAVFGGSVSLVGVIVGSVFWLPRVAAALGRLADGVGPAARLASANAARNPRRTAATSTALLVGVTLVSMMTTGAACARVTMDHQLDTRFPVDLQVAGVRPGPDGATGVPREVGTALRGVDGLGAPVRVTTASVERADGAGHVPVAAVRPADLRAVLATPADAARLRPGVLVVPERVARPAGLVGARTVTLTGAGGSVTLDVVHTDSLAPQAYLTPHDLAALAPDRQAAQLWAAVDDAADAADVVAAAQAAVAGTGRPVSVTATVLERDAYARMIDVILAVVVALLAVAVVIALIGVANTLSLSVVERTRENAVLRAIGLSTAQLRATLAIEGMVIAGVGAVLGVVLGLVYGWAGATTALSALGEVPLVVPWAEVVVVLVVALLAGLVASVAPARAATRTHPVTALAPR
ncbi:FtsX-like permease family protein [Promicromonospora citrea]|uniref:ABC transporter permease n=3 Tax=Promicromonospora citrea TaxID=43677 RepID=A0A8H9L3J6_9MICO|nr:FtsX-like permease family protein [Promicromonospora citrea]GGM27707.1 ABC transporter permease [Promicromonospora citrea]